MNAVLHRLFDTIIMSGGMIIGLTLLLPLSPLPAQVPGRSSTVSQTLSSGDLMVLKFQAAPRAESQAVRLRDLVQVISWGKREVPELLDMPLAPAPALGSTQEWTSQDVIRQLSLRGIPPNKVRWNGSESVMLMRVAPTTEVSAQRPTTKSMTPAFVQDRLIAQAEANLIEATREYLWLQTGERTDWHIKLEVPLEHASGLAQRRSIESIAGGAAPWIGPQQMTYAYKVQDKVYQLDLVAEVEPPQMIVVTTRPIRREEVLDESALAYAALPDRMRDQVGEYFEDLDQLVGKQLRRSLSTGLPVPKSSVGDPIVVSSGELIEIESVSGSVSVKTSGRALSGGAVGELINIEVLPQRKRMTATVVGPLQVRISGGGARPTTRDSDKVRNTPPIANRQQNNAMQAQRSLEGIRR